jgi:hypothetical protein
MRLGKLEGRRMQAAGWSDDFSYDYYRRILCALKGRFIPRLFGDAIALSAWSGATVLVRHDVDLSLSAAVRMAAVERDLGVRSTYMVMAQSRLYDISRVEMAQILSEIHDMGHEIGVHFDCPDDLRDDDGHIDALESLIVEDCRRIEDVLGEAVRSISFHRPVQWLLRGGLVVCGRVNAYAEELMACYLSDSKGKWRAGEPLSLVANAAGPILQLLTHPVWWGDMHQPPTERLESFFLQETKRMLPEQAACFDRILEATIPGIRRSGSIGKR